jgi:hypothetical protein
MPSASAHQGARTVISVGELLCEEVARGLAALAPDGEQREGARQRLALELGGRHQRGQRPVDVAQGQRGRAAHLGVAAAARVEQGRQHHLRRSGRERARGAREHGRRARRPRAAPVEEARALLGRAEELVARAQGRQHEQA